MEERITLRLWSPCLGVGEEYPGTRVPRGSTVRLYLVLTGRLGSLSLPTGPSRSSRARLSSGSTRFLCDRRTPVVVKGPVTRSVPIPVSPTRVGTLSPRRHFTRAPCLVVPPRCVTIFPQGPSDHLSGRVDDSGLP